MIKKIYKFENGVMYCGDTLIVMDKIIKKGDKVNLVLTSPPYNTQRNLSDRTYDIYQDGICNNKYIEWTLEIFERYEKILEENGTILYNLSYGNENPSIMFEVLYKIINKTEFMIADIITWKKKSAMPNNMSHNKLTRITEYVFVICRKKEYLTFKTNRKVSSVRKTGQKVYKIAYNYIEAKNNDKTTKLNKSTYSTELCDKLFNEYLIDGDRCLDNFSGTGTTLVSANRRNCKFIGIELSEEQCEYAKERIENDIKK